MSIFEYKDLLHYTKSFLDNKDIIELILCSKDIYKMIGQKDTFTSFTVCDKDICVMVKLFLKHKKSIYKTTLINIEDPYILWPFGTPYMIFIDCNKVDVENAYNNYKEAKKVIVKGIKKNKRPARYWH